tara:strand:- start:973 stop:1527 length:555 start_codon:yes stop_codon:yes gene_type:complete
MIEYYERLFVYTDDISLPIPSQEIDADVIVSDSEEEGDDEEGEGKEKINQGGGGEEEGKQENDIEEIEENSLVMIGQENHHTRDDEYEIERVVSESDLKKVIDEEKIKEKKEEKEKVKGPLHRLRATEEDRQKRISYSEPLEDEEDAKARELERRRKRKRNLEKRLTQRRLTNIEVCFFLLVCL